MLKRGLLFLFTFWVVVGFSQRDTLPLRGYGFKYLNYSFPNVAHNSFSSFGLVSEIQWGNNGFALGIVRGHYTHSDDNEVITGTQIMFNAGYLRDYDLFSTSIAFNATATFLGFGAAVGARQINYIKNGNNSVAVRPQAGVSYKNLLLNYGYDVFLTKKELGLQHHNITLSYFLYLFPRLY